MKSTCLRVAVPLIAIAAIASPASAKDDRGWTVTVGVGPQFIPEFPGSKDLQLAPLPVLGLRRTGDPIKFSAPGDAKGPPIVSGNGFELGPAFNITPKRKQKDVGAPVGNVKTTIEAGAFAQYFIGDNFRVRAEALHGLGGHDGWTGSVGADLIARDKDTYIFWIGPRLRFSDSKYNRAYFGVTPAAALASGLPVYRPDGGTRAWGATTGVTYQFDYHWGMTAFGRYDRLSSDAGRSPIVREFGSRNQYWAGAALTYTFDVGKIF